jgi:cytidylate kinase
MLASNVSAVESVREGMTQLQRKMAAGKDIVAEGRDMGTVVFPRAGHKFFLTASPETRAERRYRERLERGESVSRADVEKGLAKRDQQDETRPLAPLRPALDAIVIHSDRLTIEQVLQEILNHIEGK